MKILVFILIFSLSNTAFSIQRFPPPEFETEHELPVTTVPSPRSDIYEYLDVIVLLLALSVSSYLALKRRSRRGIFVMVIFSMIYFGFWRKGCVCPIGAIQNITLALSNQGYAVPITVIAFFLLPLIFSLFFGRVFCASVCPLGAIQDIFALRPLKVPAWVEHTMGTLAYIYLGFSVLFAATGSAFVICRYDPYVSFYRMSGSTNIIILGTSLLLIGVFVARPYCRYLCPYNVLLRIVSRASKWHVSITPAECINCRLCEDSCPFGAIQKPNEEKAAVSRSEGKIRLAILMLILPIIIVSGVLIGIRSGKPLSQVNTRVQLAQRVWMEDNGMVEGTTEQSDAFKKTGKPKEELYQEAVRINRKFTIGSGILGGFIGLVIGSKIIQLSVRRSRTYYEVNRASCLSCGRCFSYCPVKNK